MPGVKLILKRAMFCIVALFVLLAGVIQTSCARPHYENRIETDSVQVVDMPLTTADLSFTSYGDVLSFQNDLIIQEIFKTIPQDVLQNVMSVCLAKNSLVSIRDIVFEYRANSEVYDNLANNLVNIRPQEQQTQQDSTVLEERRRLVDSVVSYSIDTITVNGRTIKILTQRE